MNDYYNSICVLSWITLVILSILIHENARIPTKEKRLFYITYLLIGLAELAEWAGLLLNGESDNMMTLLKIVKCADYTLTPMVSVLLVKQMKVKNKLSYVITGAITFNTVFQIISVFNGWIFYITPENTYEAGPLYGGYLVVAIMIIFTVAIQFIIYGRKYRKQNQVSLYSILVLVLTSIGMQELVSTGIRTLYIGVTIAMALLFIHVTEYTQMETDDYLTEQLIKINTDALTGILSRHAYSQALNEYNAMDKLPSDFVAFSIDINGLKKVNDTLGHEAGDELIIGAARCIEEAVGDLGKCYRTGGDEFIVLANTDKVGASRLNDALFEKTNKWHGKKVKELHLSIGYALASDYPQLIAEKLINEADVAMYAAKAVFYQAYGRK
ncbi:MAG: GGDEF domain-containing protein [Eubacterium sp.]|nr:GGDEF domain-containing protein [Eubacterium sp.]